MFKSIDVITDIPKAMKLENWPKFANFQIKNLRYLIPIQVNIIGTQTHNSEIEPSNFLNFAIRLMPNEERTIQFNITGGKLLSNIENKINIGVSSSLLGLNYRPQFNQTWDTQIATRRFVLVSTGKQGNPINWINIIDQNNIIGNPPNLNTSELKITQTSQPFEITINKQVSVEQIVKLTTNELQSAEYIIQPPKTFKFDQNFINNLSPHIESVIMIARSIA
jgi:hypothetical protein